MADRTWMTVALEPVDKPTLDRIIDALKPVAGTPTFGPDRNIGDADTTREYVQFSYEESVVGTLYEVEDVLRRFDGLAFTVREDPKYEYPGEGVTVTADGTRFMFDCFKDGEPVVRVSTLAKLLADTAGDPDALADGLRALLPPADRTAA